jgi:putative DNA primase/helicase
MISLAKSRPGIPIVPDELDADPWALNTASGTIDLRSGKLREHRRDDLITKMAPPEYDPVADAPIFERFLERVLPLESVRQFLQRAVGYAAVGVVREEVLPILHGSGANGKTTLTGVLMEALGDYAMQAAPDLLMLKRGTHPTELSDLFGARFVVSTETEDGRRLAESVVKNLTGRERIKARRMREDFWEFDPTHTVFLSTNHRPEVKGTDHAIWRRPKLIPFTVTIPDHEQDKSLPEKLRGELPGVLAWIVRGALQYQTGGLGVPEQVEHATNVYRSEMDTLAAFFEDRCVIDPKATVPATPLYRSYQRWCDDSGEASESQKRFSSRLLERGFDSFRYTAGSQRGRKGWSGIGLRDDHHDGGPDGGEGPPGPHAGVNDQSRTSGDEREQVARNAPKTTEDRSQREGSAHNRSHHESAIDMEQTPDGDASVKDREGFFTISGSDLSREDVMPKNGSHPSHPSQTLSEDDAPVRSIVADPPVWLAPQLAKYRDDPERLKKPTATAIAAKVFGTAQRWREVAPVLEELIDGGDAETV